MKSGLKKQIAREGLTVIAIAILVLVLNRTGKYLLENDFGQSRIIYELKVKAIAPPKADSTSGGLEEIDATNLDRDLDAFDEIDAKFSENHPGAIKWYGRKIVDLSSWCLFFSYPLFLLLRFIAWAIKTLRG